ncbi:hypothetical protein, partial [Burkholderia pyrrocinia]|uniref:hypothetical protein n=1 Tax=Burkholderia pyrrocinia TaxID=60550 RepID=UPI001C2CD0E4
MHQSLCVTIRRSCWKTGIAGKTDGLGTGLADAVRARTGVPRGVAPGWVAPTVDGRTVSSRRAGAALAVPVAGGTSALAGRASFDVPAAVARL